MIKLLSELSQTKSKKNRYLVFWGANHQKCFFFWKKSSDSSFSVQNVNRKSLLVFDLKRKNIETKMENRTKSEQKRALFLGVQISKKDLFSKFLQNVFLSSENHYLFFILNFWFFISISAYCYSITTLIWYPRVVMVFWDYFLLSFWFYVNVKFLRYYFVLLPSQPEQADRNDQRAVCVPDWCEAWTRVHGGARAYPQI